MSIWNKCQWFGPQNNRNVRGKGTTTHTCALAMKISRNRDISRPKRIDKILRGVDNRGNRYLYRKCRCNRVGGIGTRRRTVGGRDAGVTRCGGWSSASMAVGRNRRYLFYLLSYSTLVCCMTGPQGSPRPTGLARRRHVPTTGGSLKLTLSASFAVALSPHDGKPESEAADAPRDEIGSNCRLFLD